MGTEEKRTEEKRTEEKREGWDISLWFYSVSCFTEEREAQTRLTVYGFSVSGIVK